jgi:phage baseplate assembly protein V
MRNDFIRLGVISEVEVNGTRARVKLADKLVTDFLPVLQIANSYKREWTPLRVKEQVVVLPVLGELNSGVILRGIYYTEFQAPSTDANTQKTVYKDGTDGTDGTEITYTPSTKTLNITGNVNITISGNANITVQNADITAQSIKAQASSAELTCPNTSIIGNVKVEGSITATETITGLSVVGTTMTVGGAGGSELKSEGGKFSIDRPLDVKGDVKSSGLVYDKFGAIRTQNNNGGGN